MFPIPLFFFDHYNGEYLDRDETGLVFPDLDSAYLEAIRAATEMWGEALLEVRNPGRERFEIRDLTGQVLLVLPFSEIIETGKGARRLPPSFAELTATAGRVRNLEGDVRAQIDLARSCIS